MTYEPQEERIARVIARVLGRPQDVVAEDAQAVEARADLRKDLHLDRAVGKRYGGSWRRDELHGGGVMRVQRRSGGGERDPRARAPA